LKVGLVLFVLIAGFYYILVTFFLFRLLFSKTDSFLLS